MPERVNESEQYLTLLNITNITFFDIEDVMGPQREPLGTALLMTFMYTMILVTGMVGNICTCIVIARNRYMHTATNYYLFSLAVSDLLFLVLGLPQEMYQLWKRYPYDFGEVFCVFRGWASESSTNASILTITAFTVERYLAICHPLRAHTMSKLSRAIKFIVVVWICAALVAIVFSYQFGIVYELDPMGNEVLETAYCGMKRPLPHSFESATFAFFILPGTLLLTLYVLIGLQLRRSEDIGRKHNGQATNGVKRKNALNRQSTRKNSASSRKAVVKMLGREEDVRRRVHVPMPFNHLSRRIRYRSKALFPSSRLLHSQDVAANDIFLQKRSRQYHLWPLLPTPVLVPACCFRVPFLKI